jgi:hypothetical protein
MSTTTQSFFSLTDNRNCRRDSTRERNSPTMPYTKGVKAAGEDEMIGDEEKLHNVRLDYGSQEVLEVSWVSPG